VDWMVRKLPDWLCRRIAVSVVYAIGLAFITQPLILYITYWSPEPIVWSHVANVAAASIVVNAVVAFSAISLLDIMRRRRITNTVNDENEHV
jgi:hypothetical protein